MKTSLLRSLLVTSLFACVQLVHAHALPVHQVPAAGASVAVEQKDVAIDFDETLEPAFSAIAVTDSLGEPTTTGHAAIDPANRKHMSVMLKPLVHGSRYEVSWIAVGLDGHRTQGRYRFMVK